jgi:hypothetical protein
MREVFDGYVHTGMCMCRVCAYDIGGVCVEDVVYAHTLNELAMCTCVCVCMCMACKHL